MPRPQRRGQSNYFWVIDRGGSTPLAQLTKPNLKLLDPKLQVNEFQFRIARYSLESKYLYIDSCISMSETDLS